MNRGGKLVELIASLATGVACAAGMPVEWPKDVLFRTPKVYPADEYGTNGVEVAFLEGLPYHGKPTKMFCYYGVPKHGVGEKVPGMAAGEGLALTIQSNDTVAAVV